MSSDTPTYFLLFQVCTKQAFHFLIFKFTCYTSADPVSRCILEGGGCQRCHHIQICSTPGWCRPTPENNIATKYFSMVAIGIARRLVSLRSQKVMAVNFGPFGNIVFFIAMGQQMETSISR